MSRQLYQQLDRGMFLPCWLERVPEHDDCVVKDLARLGVLVANKGQYGLWELFSAKTCESIMPVPLQEYIPNLDEPRTRGIGFTTMAPGFYGHSGGCGTRLLVDPANHLVFAMTRMKPDDKFKEFNQEALDLLQQFREGQRMVRNR